ncbi:prenyltransferase [Candidatus Bathyarchaeota archaeon]|nr:prenyltransferase [Candidatus Bathyarchaeota archaeon]MBS7630721.1 prenyltransferase [Candidatus Bathyarchaeota archaeon]
MNLKIWFKETRPHFLLITPLIYSIGLAQAYIDGYFNVFYAVIGLIGALLAHISVNVINDYFDFKSGLDLRTRRTPFSGGSGILPAGLLNARDVYFFSLSCLTLDLVIGLYFIHVKGLMLLPLVLTAALTIYFYTPHLSRWMVGEFFTGLNFGPLLVLGSYFIQSGAYSLNALAAGVIPGILIGCLLFLNEFPDVEADKEVGRMNLVIRFGLRPASRMYAALITMMYVWIFVSILLRLMPVSASLIYLTLPLALKTIRSVTEYYDAPDKIVSALSNNVMLDLSALTLTAIGIFASKFL